MDPNIKSSYGLQGSVQIDGKKIVDPKAKVSLRSGQILRLDKTHAVRIK